MKPLRILALVLALMMLLGTFPAATFAATGGNEAEADGEPAPDVRGGEEEPQENEGEEPSEMPEPVGNVVVSYNANGGTGTMTDETVAVGGTYTVPSCAFTRSGYTFDRWLVNGAYAEPGDDVTLTQDTVVRALWLNNVCTLAFNGNGGAGTMSDVTVARGSVYTLPECAFLPSGTDVFESWLVNGQKKQPAETVTVDGDLLIAAIWTGTCVLTYDAGGGEGTTVPATVPFDTNVTLASCTFTKEDYHFVGWQLNGRVRGAGSQYRLMNDLTATAVWEEDPIVFFDKSGGTGSMDSVHVTPGGTLTLPACAFTKTGHYFAGWQIGNTTYQPGGTVTVGGNLTAKALWEKGIKVCFDTNGGVGVLAPDVVRSGSSYSLPDCPFTRSGYRFTGWQIGADTTPRQAGYSFTATSDVTVRATWEVNFSVEWTNLGFKITRTVYTKAETVRYRTVSKTALAGVHFTETVGTLTFEAGIPTKYVSVTELSSAGYVDRYTYGVSTRFYTFEVLTTSYEVLTSVDKDIAVGNSYNITNAGIFSEQSIAVLTTEKLINDKGFKSSNNGYTAVPISNYFSATAPQAYLKAIGATLRMKLEMDVKEKDDGYQFVQILVNQTSNADTGNSNESVGNINYATYLASFAHYPGNKYTPYNKYCFPVLSAGDNCQAVDPAWNYSPYNNGVGKLYTQKFNGSRADDGRLLIPVNLNTLGLRFDASGDNDDDWYVNNIYAKIQAYDNTAPSVISVYAAPGEYGYGDSITVCLHFDEIVCISGTPTIGTNFGTLTYGGGSGTSVLYFTGTVTKSSALSSLAVNTISSAIRDIAGNTRAEFSPMTVSGASYTEPVTITVIYNDNDGTTASYTVRRNGVFRFPDASAYAPDNCEFVSYAIPTVLGVYVYYEGSSFTASGNYTAHAGWNRITYPVSFLDEDGSLLESENVYCGDAPAYAETPVKESTEAYDLTFTGWRAENGTVYAADSLPAITADETFKAVYHTALRRYKVTWLDHDGSVLTSKYYNFGSIPSLDGSPQFTYTEGIFAYLFSGWDRAYESVRGDTIYTPRYNKTAQQYQIRLYSDADTFYSYSLTYGVTPAPRSYAPHKEGDAQYTYAWTGEWSPALTYVTGSADYTAVYESILNAYTVRFVDEDGTVLQASRLYYGETPVYTGQTPTKPADAQYTYTFAGWTPAIAAVTGDATYTAIYTETVNIYTVRFVDEDGTVLETSSVAYGETPVYTGQTPTKPADAQYTYTFAGWTPAIAAVTGDVTYTAIYAETVNIYTVRFVDEDGTLLQTSSVAYGETPVYTGQTPTKASANLYTYVFTGWTPGISEVTGDATYTAVFATGWTVLNERLASASTDGEHPTVITLDRDYAASPDDGALVVPAGRYVTLDLNGHILNRNLETATAAGYVILVHGTLTINDSAPNAEHMETAALTGGVITGGNSSENAGGVYVKGGTLTLNGGCIYENTAKYNGGVSVAKGGRFTMTNGSISNNKATSTDGGGVGVYSGCAFTMEGGTISENSAAANAGGVFVSSGSFIMTGGTVIGNSAWSKGGGVYVSDSGTFTMTGGAVTVNDVHNFGGGVCINSGVFAISGSPVVTNNTEMSYSDSNVYLMDTAITVVGALSDTARLGVTKLSGGVFTNGADFADDASARAVFTADEYLCEIFAEDGEAKIEHLYAVNFVNEDGSMLDLQFLPAGAMPVYGNGTPAKQGNAQYTYTFAGWTPAITAVTGDVTYTATYSSTVNTYTVRFVDEDGTVLETSSVAYGETPVYSGQTPAKQGNAQYAYAFVGWTPAIAAVTGDATYTAIYTETVNIYTVRFVDEDGTALETSSGVYGETPVYNGQTPAKPADAQYTYTFAGWTPAITAVTGNATYTATYTATVNTYTVYFVNYDGEVWQTDENMPYGAELTYRNDTPSKPADGEYCYIFAGWTPEIGPVTGDVTYTAVYTAKPLALAPGENAVWPQSCNTYFFTPEETGWYIFFESSGNGLYFGSGGSYIDTAYSFDGAALLYLNAGTTYTVWLDIYGTTPIQSTLTVGRPAVYALGVSAQHCTIGFADTNGNAVTNAPEGARIRMTVTCDEGYLPLSYVTVTDESGETVPSSAYEFNMPGKAVTAAQTCASAKNLTLRVDEHVAPYGRTLVMPVVASGFMNTTDVYQAAPGAQILLAGVYALPNYVISSVKVNGVPYQLENSNLTFTMPDEDAVIEIAARGVPLTVTFFDEDGETVLASVETPYGELPVYPGFVPVKAGYVFAGWDRELKAVTEPTSYTAHFTAGLILGENTLCFNPLHMPSTYYRFVPTETGYYRMTWAPVQADLAVNNVWSTGEYSSSSGSASMLQDENGYVSGCIMYLEEDVAYDVETVLWDYSSGAEPIVLTVLFEGPLDGHAVTLNTDLREVELNTLSFDDRSPAGAIVWLECRSDSYRIESWNVVDAYGNAVETFFDDFGYAFIMPDCDVTVTPTAVYPFKITVEKNGDASFSSGCANDQITGTQFSFRSESRLKAYGGDEVFLLYHIPVDRAFTVSVTAEDGSPVSVETSVYEGYPYLITLEFVMPGQPVEIDIDTSAPPALRELHEGDNLNVTGQIFRFTPSVSGIYDVYAGVDELTGEKNMLFLEILDAEYRYLGSVMYERTLTAGEACFFLFDDEIDLPLLTVGLREEKAAHTVTVVTEESYGTVTAPGTAPAGSRVFIEIVPDGDHTVQAVEVTYTEDGTEYGNAYTVYRSDALHPENLWRFEMPDADVTVTVFYRTVQRLHEGDNALILGTDFHEDDDWYYLFTPLASGTYRFHMPVSADAPDSTLYYGEGAGNSFDMNVNQSAVQENGSFDFETEMEGGVTYTLYFYFCDVGCVEATMTITKVNAGNPYDLNGDGTVNISDISALLNHLAIAVEYDAHYDMNGDSAVTISDVTHLLDYLSTMN